MSQIPSYMLGGTQPSSSAAPDSLRGQNDTFAGSNGFHTPSDPAQQPPSDFDLPPGMDMSALAGIKPEQVALIAYLFKTGKLPLPSAPLPAASASLLPPQGALVVPAETSTAAPPLRDRDSSAHENFGGPALDGGSTSEEHVEQKQVRDFLRPPPTGPRSLSNGQQRTPPAPSGPRAMKAPKFSHAQASKNSQEKREAAVAQGDTNGRLGDPEDFVMKLVEAGYSFEQLASEVSNPRPLRRMFEKLGLSDSTGSRVGSVFVGAVSPAHAQDDAPKLPVPKRVVPNKPAVVIDRKEYLARLQAAKNKKTEIPAPVANAVESVEPVQPTPPMTDATKPLLSPTPSAAKLPQPNKADKNELLRQKLAAVKAEHAAKQAAKRKLETLAMQEAPRSTSLASSPSSMDQRENISAATTENPGKETVSAQYAPVDPTSTSQPVTGGLPGLFKMGETRSPFQSTMRPFQISTPAAPLSSLAPFHPATASETSPIVNADAQAPLSISSQTTSTNTTSRKRPVAADFDDIPAVASNHTKRPFGQSRNQSEDNSIIIENSDDEDEDNEGIYANKPMLSQFATKPFRDAGPLRDFPPRFASHSLDSVPGTPGGSTPNGSDYQRVILDIENMNRKIAEMERRKAGKSTAPIENAASSTLAGHPLPATLAAHTPRSAKAEKERLQRRIHELESNERHAVSESPHTTRDSQISETQERYVIPMTAETEPNLRSDKDSIVEQKSAVNEGLNSLSSDEEGELSDESISKFYQNQSAGPASPRQTPSKGEDANVPMDETTADYMPEQPDGDPVISLVESSSASSTSGDEPMMESDSDSEDEQLQSSVRPVGQSSTLDMAPQTTQQAPDASEALRDEFISAFSTLPPLSQLSPHTYIAPALSEDSDDNSSSGSSATPLRPGLHEIEKDESNTDSQLQPADDLAPELQAPELQPPLHDQMEHLKHPPADGTKYYKPYTSSLTMFKNYRYHPEYSKTVAGGFQSLTYSNKIDPNRPICRYEAAGGQCNDPTCDGQHFASMSIPEKELLESFCKSQVPAHSPEELTKWIEGLSSLIQDLKVRKLGNDVNSIATRIAEYRRTFVGDPTKLLSFG